MSSSALKKAFGVNSNKLLKGCNCKRTRCQKNFCECYKNSKLCTDLCKCLDCQNVTARNVPLLEVQKKEKESHSEPVVEETYIIENEVPINSYTIVTKNQCRILTPDVVESITECVIAQAAECQKNGLTTKDAEQMIIKEFGRCFDEVLRLSDMQNIFQ